jgi:hypothetical protein
MLPKPTFLLPSTSLLNVVNADADADAVVFPLDEVEGMDAIACVVVMTVTLGGIVVPGIVVAGTTMGPTVNVV